MDEFIKILNVYPNVLDCWIYTVILIDISVHFYMIALSLKHAIWNQHRKSWLLQALPLLRWYFIIFFCLSVESCDGSLLISELAMRCNHKSTIWNEEDSRSFHPNFNSRYHFLYVSERL